MEYLFHNSQCTDVIQNDVLIYLDANYKLRTSWKLIKFIVIKVFSRLYKKLLGPSNVSCVIPDYD